MKKILYFKMSQPFQFTFPTIGPDSNAFMACDVNGVIYYITLSDNIKQLTDQINDLKTKIETLEKKIDDEFVTLK